MSGRSLLLDFHGCAGRSESEPCSHARFDLFLVQAQAWLWRKRLGRGQAVTAVPTFVTRASSFTGRRWQGFVVPCALPTDKQANASTTGCTQGRAEGGAG